MLNYISSKMDGSKSNAGKAVLAGFLVEIRLNRIVLAVRTKSGV